MPDPENLYLSFMLVVSIIAAVATIAAVFAILFLFGGPLAVTAFIVTIICVYAYLDE